MSSLPRPLAAGSLPRPLAAGSLLVLLGSLLLVPSGITGCSADDVVVAELPAGPPGGGGGGSDQDCSSSTDCGPFSYCQKEGPSSDRGECRPRPVSCGDEHEETCGCDGITYWNDCLRQQLGVSCARKGRCLQEAALCGGPAQLGCPVPGASCARLFPPGSVCAPDAPGQCWFLPPDCPTPQGPPTFGPCGGPMGPCVDPCEAIRSQAPYMLYPGPLCKKGM